MTLINCNLAKAASAIFTSKDIEPTEIINVGTESYTFGVYSDTLGNCTLSVSGSPNSVIIETSVMHKHSCFGHPKSKFQFELLESESNDTYVNAARLAIASIEHSVGLLETYLKDNYDNIFNDKTGYEFGDGKEVKGSPATLLDYNLTHAFPKEWLVEYTSKKSEDDKDSFDKYLDVDIGDVDINKVTAVDCFFSDMSWDRVYSDDCIVNKMKLSSLRDAINWVLTESGSKQTVDSKTVLAALMSSSLKSKHVVFDSKDEINDSMIVNVPDCMFDLVIIYRNHKQ